MTLAAGQRDTVAADPGAVISRLLESPVLRARAPVGPGGLAGLEQEYGVWRAGRQVDFGELIERVVPARSLRLFAFDLNARMVPSGAVWTVDAPHAEVATPPRPLRIGMCGRLADDALREREVLASRIEVAFPSRAHGAATVLRGYSTHLNAFAAGPDGGTLARHFATTYAPAVMLLAERRGSPGLLVRPRPERLEIGTEFLEGRDDLVAVSAVVIAAVMAAWQECMEAGDRGAWATLVDTPRSHLAPLRGEALRPTWQRPGLFVPPDAFGDHLYQQGRAARLQRMDGGVELAGDRLVATWERLRPIAATFALPSELQLVDERVDGTAPVPLERAAPVDPLVRRLRRRPRRDPGEQAALLRVFRRGRVRLAPRLATWDFTIMRIEHPRRTFYLRLPRAASEPFVQLLSAGRLDTPLAAYAARAPSGRIARLDDAQAGLYDEVEAPQDAAARLENSKSGGPGGPPKARKPRPPLPLPLPPPPSPTPTPRARSRWLLPLVGILIMLTVVTIGLWPRQPGTIEPTPASSVPCGTTLPLAGVACASPSTALPTTSPSGCAVGVACATASPTASATASVTASACPIGAVCGSPTPTPAATPTRSPRPTPTPDRTGPSITRLAWTPPTIGVPLVPGGPCDPATGLGQTVRITVVVTDPSGIASVTLRYWRARDTSPVNAPMAFQGGRYVVVLSTANDQAGWMPFAGQLSYVVGLSVRAVDGRGNTRTTARAPAFTVQNC